MTTPAMIQKAQIVVGAVFGCVAILTVWELNSPKSIEELDRQQARKDEKYRGWSVDRIEMVKKLKAIARRGRMMTHTYGERR
jgi:hypothetical protein